MMWEKRFLTKNVFPIYLYIKKYCFQISTIIYKKYSKYIFTFFVTLDKFAKVL